MPADNDVPGLLLSLRDLAGRCRPAAMLYLTEDDSNMLDEAADALDRAQRERDALNEQLSRQADYTVALQREREEELIAFCEYLGERYSVSVMQGIPTTLVKLFRASHTPPEGKND